MTVSNPLDPNRPITADHIKGRTITTNKVTLTAEDLRRVNGHPEPEPPKSNLVILAVTALVLGWIMISIAIFAVFIPLYVLGFATILSSLVLAILSLRE